MSGRGAALDDAIAIGCLDAVLLVCRISNHVARCMSGRGAALDDAIAIGCLDACDFSLFAASAVPMRSEFCPLRNYACFSLFAASAVPMRSGLCPHLESSVLLFVSL